MQFIRNQFIKLTFLILLTFGFILILTKAKTENRQQKTAQIPEQYVNQLITFSEDFTIQDQDLIKKIIDQSNLPNLDLIGQLQFHKMYDKTYRAESNFGGIIFLNQKLFVNKDYQTLNKVVIHELGHMYDFHTFTEESRAKYAQLRKLDLKSEQINNWFQGYHPEINEGAVNLDQWKAEPAEDLAEVFAHLYSNIEDESIILKDKPIEPEIKPFFDKYFNDIKKYQTQAKAQSTSINTQIMLEKLATTAANPAKILNLPRGYGVLTYLFPKISLDEEYVFVSYNLDNSNKQIHYYYGPKGYDHYDSYFQKAADKIIYYGGKNYYLLDNQGQNKDYQLMADGAMVVMSNDPKITEDDLLVMIEEAVEYPIISH